MNKTSRNDYPKSCFQINFIICPMTKILKNINKLFRSKYSEVNMKYELNIINNIMFNEKSHIVATFKDHLIIDDIGEFLKRYYSKEESDIRLKKFYKYYDFYSKIFPNYTVFPEGKYLYLNIIKKQRIIDLLEQMKLEKNKKVEKRDLYRYYLTSNEKVFNTDVINSILNVSNNEFINYLFNINKDDVINEEIIFENDVKNLIKEINKYELKEKKREPFNNMIKFDRNRIEKNNEQINIKKGIKFNNQLYKNIYNYNNNNNINSVKTNKDTVVNKYYPIPINLNYSKIKRMVNLNSSSTANNSITNYNNVKDVIIKFFNCPLYQTNIFFNMNNGADKNQKIEKIEQDLFKMKQKSFITQKHSSQSMSINNQTFKELSVSKKKANVIYTKIPVNSSSFKKIQKNLRKYINNSIGYRVQNSNMENYMENRKKGILLSTSKDVNFHKFLDKIEKNENFKNIKGKTFYNYNVVSRNKYSKIVRNHNDITKSALIGNVSNFMDKINQSKTSKSNQKKLLNNTKIKVSDSKTKKDCKDINFIRNKNSRNRNEIKEKILKSGLNFENRKNIVKSTTKNNSKQKNDINKKNKNFNDSLFISKIKDIMSVQNIEKGFNIKNFAKVINSINHNCLNKKKNLFKTHGSNYGNIKKQVI